MGQTHDRPANEDEFTDLLLTARIETQVVAAVGESGDSVVQLRRQVMGARREMSIHQRCDLAATDVEDTHLNPAVPG